MNFLKYLIFIKGLCKVDISAKENSDTKNNHIEEMIQQLGKNLFLSNALSNQKRMMHQSMCKPRYLEIQRYTECFTKLNKYLSLLLGSYVAKKMDEEEMNDILFHILSNVWVNQSY